jgi:integrase
MPLWKTKWGWRYQFQQGGKRLSECGFKTKAEARAALEQHRARLKSLPTLESASPEWEFASLMADYLEEAERRFRIKTFKYKRFVYQNFLDYAGNLPLSQITDHLVGRYLLTRPSNYNFNFHRKDLSALFRWAMDRGLMPANPCAKIDTLPVEDPDLIHVTQDEWARFLLAAGPYRPFFLVVFHTLARVGEILRLKWSDVDFERNEIRLWTRKRKGGNMEFEWLPMESELREALLGLKRKREHPELVFMNPKTGTAYTQRRRLIQGICKRAGVRVFGFHAIRHYGADVMMDRGVDLRTISRYLRHKSLRTTEIYLRRRPDENLKRAAKLLENTNLLSNPLSDLSQEKGKAT